jgi:AraC-like DNA-binding protein
MAYGWQRGGTREAADVAERVGYAFASTFSTAFSRYVGQPPACFARSHSVA